MARAVGVHNAASGEHGGVTNQGSWSTHGTFKLTAKRDDTAIEIEYEIDTNRAGQQFAVRLTDKGTVIAKRTAPSPTSPISSSMA